MKFEVVIAARPGRDEDRRTTVLANHWVGALTAALHMLGEKGDGSGSRVVDLMDGGVVRVWEPETRRLVVLQNLDHVAPPSLTPVFRGFVVPGVLAAPYAAASAPVPAPAEETGTDGDGAPAAAPAEPGLPAHQVFFARDENPEDGSTLCYRERLLAVDAGTARGGINALLMAYFEGLRNEVEARAEAKYVNLAVFDHAFSARAERPALAALSWKSWRSEVPEVIYPMDQPSVPMSYAVGAQPAPAEPSAAAPAAAPVRKATPAVSPVRKPTPAVSPVRKPTPGVVPAVGDAPARKTGRRRIPTPADLARLGQPAEEAVIGEILANVFEDMHGLFGCRTREAACEFALDVAMRRIPCEAGSVLLSDINSRDLVFTAVRGEAAPRLHGQRVSIDRGIVSYAAKAGVTIAVPDVSKDARFAKEFDSSVGFKTRSVIVSPLVHEGRNFGAIELLNRTGSDSFLQVETSVVSYVGSMLAEHLATVVPSVGAFGGDGGEAVRKPRPQPQASAPARAAPAAGKSARGGKKRR